MHESQLITLLLDRDMYIRFHKHLKEYTVLPETWEIIEDIGHYYKAHPDEPRISVGSFIPWARVVRHPSWSPVQWEGYETILEIAGGLKPDPTIIDRMYELATAIDIKDKVDDAIHKGGTDTLDNIGKLIDDYRRHVAAGGHDDPLAPYDLRDVFESLTRVGGLRWRLQELNVSVGPICKSDFVIVGKRPEVGGTTFLCSEFTHMLPQLPEGATAVIFNNEESRNKVYARLMQSALNSTVMDMAADPDKTTDKYTKFLGTRHIDVIHDTSMTTAKVEAVLKRKKYDLIGFNVLWKVRPWGKLEDYQRYEHVAQWARKVADQHAPVVAVWQADASAEGVEWMNQSQLYGSKTGVQGEADVQLMIGMSNEPGLAHERYISVVKNKTPGSAGTLPSMRHGRFIVDIDPERGRFLSRMK